MDDAVFQTAYEASRQAVADEQWASLAVRERAALIYQEMRRIDADNARLAPDTRPGGGCGPRA